MQTKKMMKNYGRCVRLIADSKGPIAIALLFSLLGVLCNTVSSITLKKVVDEAIVYGVRFSMISRWTSAAVEVLAATDRAKLMIAYVIPLIAIFSLSLSVQKKRSVYSADLIEQDILFFSQIAVTNQFLG